MSGQLHGPAASPPVFIWKEVGWVTEPVWTPWQREKFLPILGIETRSSSP